MYQMLGWDHKAVILPKFTENSFVHQEGLGIRETGTSKVSDVKAEEVKEESVRSGPGGAVGRARQRPGGIGTQDEGVKCVSDFARSGGLVREMY